MLGDDASGVRHPAVLHVVRKPVVLHRMVLEGGVVGQELLKVRVHLRQEAEPDSMLLVQHVHVGGQGLQGTASALCPACATEASWPSAEIRLRDEICGGVRRERVLQLVHIDLEYERKLVHARPQPEHPDGDLLKRQWSVRYSHQG